MSATRAEASTTLTAITLVAHLTNNFNGVAGCLEPESSALFKHLVWRHLDESRSLYSIINDCEQLAAERAMISLRAFLDLSDEVVGRILDRQIDWHWSIRYGC